MENSNSSFEKIIQLQKILKEEISLSDIISENLGQILGKIKDVYMNYYSKRLSIQEIYDNIKIDLNKRKTYEITEKMESSYISPFQNFLLYLRNSMDLTLKIAQNCPQESYEILANFIYNNFYSNITSSSILNENFLTFIFLLLQKEIDKLNDLQLSNEFLEPSKSFCGTLLKYLTRNDEVKIYLEKILRKVLIDIAGLFLPNQKNKMFIGFEIEKINNFLKKDKCSLSRSQKKYTDYNDLFTKDIKKSRLNMKFLKCLKEKENENELINNNFYVQINRDDFDNLLLGNIKEVNEIKILYDQDPENKQSLRFEDKKGGENNFETYLLNSGFFILKKQNEEVLIREEESKFIEKNRDKLFNDLYNKGLNKDSLLNYTKEIEEQSQVSHGIIEEYINSKINFIEDNRNFSNDNIIKEISNVSKSPVFIERFILIYKYHFEVIRQFVDELLISLISNTKNTPYIIRAICSMIFKLLEKKFPQITNNQKILFVSKFFFNDLIIPILTNPEFNGIMPYNFDDKTANLINSKLKVFIEIIKKLLNDELFDSSKKGEEYYTIFNPYFIEVMPHIIEFFKNLSFTELPKNILSLINGGNNIENKCLEIHPEEQFYQSICINWIEYIEISKIIKLNPTFYFEGNKDLEALNKLKIGFGNLTTKENLFKQKVDNDEESSKKTYVYYFDKMPIDKLKEKITGKKNKKIAFEQEDVSNNENPILGKIKDCFYIILKNLNTLSKNNFDRDESVENIVKGLNIIINKEDINGTLKENNLPLNWYGTYLESYIDKIPSDYKENNFSKLFKELIDEYSENLNIYKNNKILNILYNKLINGENMVKISQNFLTKLKNDNKKLDILHFILTKQIPIIIKIYRNKEKKTTKIEFMKLEDKSTSKGEMIKIKCNNILEFCDSFPDLAKEAKEQDIDDIFQFEEGIELSNALNGYFKIIYEYLEKEPFLEECQQEEQIYVKIKIQDFIYEHIYEKIYPNNFTNPLDIKILTNCFTHKWIKPINLDEKLKNLDDKIIQMMRALIRKIVERKSPNDKLKEFENFDFMINNIILLHGYPKDTYLKIMGLAFIKELSFKSYRLYSLYKYIKIFHYSSKAKDNEIINQFEILLNKINNFSFKDFVGISEDEYKKNYKNAKTTTSQ